VIDFPASPTNGQIFTSGALSWRFDGTKWVAQGAATASTPYIVGCFVPGPLAGSQLLLHHRFARAVALPANFDGVGSNESQAGGSVAATGSTVITVSKALAVTPTTFSNIGTITIIAGSVSPVFDTSAAPVAFAAGDVIRLIAPASPDAGFAGFNASLVFEG
jgi:hypothetical protein